MYAVVMQVLQTGQEITELDSSGFVTSSPTVFAGNIGEKKYILQVSVCVYMHTLLFCVCCYGCCITIVGHFFNCTTTTRR